VLDEIEKDSTEENRSVSFIVNNILQKYYVAEKRIEVDADGAVVDK